MSILKINNNVNNTNEITDDIQKQIDRLEHKIQAIQDLKNRVNNMESKLDSLEEFNLTQYVDIKLLKQVLIDSVRSRSVEIPHPYTGIADLTLKLLVESRRANDGIKTIYENKCDICLNNYSSFNRETLLTPCQHKLCKQCSLKVSICPFDRNVIKEKIEYKEHNSGKILKQEVINPRRRILIKNLNGELLCEFDIPDLIEQTTPCL
jgi:hypothetical protein